MENSASSSCPSQQDPCSEGIRWLMQTLIQFGAWTDSKDTLGLSPLYYAASGGNTECVLRLLLAKADTEVIDEHGKSALHQVFAL